MTCWAMSWAVGGFRDPGRHAGAVARAARSGVTLHLADLGLEGR